MDHGKYWKNIKKRREELGLSLEEVSEKTRLTTKHIKAIEEGDITYFKDDLSYLRYFLKAYCNALDVDFEEVKGLLQNSIDDYTMSFSTNLIKEHEKMEANIHEASKKYHRESKKKDKKPRKKIDFSLVSLLTIIIIAVISILLVFVMYILPNLTNDDVKDPVDKPAVPEVQPEPEPEPEKPVEKPKSELVLTADKNKIMVNEFESGKEITVEITFGENSWFEYRLNNVVMGEPVSKVYSGNTKLEVKITPKENDEMRFRLGRFKNSSFKVDGKEVVLDETVSAAESVQDISFVFNKAKKEA